MGTVGGKNLSAGLQPVQCCSHHSVIAVLLQGLQQCSGLLTDRLAVAFSHQTPKDFGATHPHSAISISDRHHCELQQPTEGNLWLLGKGRKNAATHEPGFVSSKSIPKHRPGPFHAVTGQSIGSLRPHIGIVIGTQQAAQHSPALFIAFVTQATATERSHQKRLLLCTQNQQLYGYIVVEGTKLSQSWHS